MVRFIRDNAIIPMANLWTDTGTGGFVGDEKVYTVQTDSRAIARCVLMAEIKAKYPRAYEKWTATEDAELQSMSAKGRSEEALAQHFQRQPSAIRSRLEKLAGASGSRRID